MGKLYRNLCLCIGMLIFFFWAMYPPQEKLRLGKDLAGGVTLVYQLDIASNEDASKVVNDTISALKDRVDPDGLLEISMVRQGRDRIEISMPLPRQEVKDLRAKYEEELRNLGRNALTRDRLSDVLSLPAAERATRITELSSGNPKRKELLEKLVGQHDTAKLMREELAKAKAKAANAPANELDNLIDKAGEAELGAEESLKGVIATFLPAAEVRQALTLSEKQESIQDAKGKLIKTPSPRERALTRLRTAYPDAVPDLERVQAAFNAYAAKRTSLDDPQDLIRMLQGAGVLSFRITVDPNAYPEEQRLRQELRAKGPAASRSNEVRWFKINRIANWYNSITELERLTANPSEYFLTRGYVAEEYQGQYYLLCWDIRGNRLTRAEGDWSVASASESKDQTGLPAISFTMDARGAILLGDLTKDHVNQKMAVLLDDEVYTAPNLRSAISRNGQITGSFTPEEIRYIVRVLGGGSLQTKMSPEPISLSSVGPELGSDNLSKGFMSGVVAIIVVSAFIVVYYFGAGMIAVVALFANAIIVLGALALNKAAFSMPGIAGVILTFGMAVDSNVLVYERIREEILRGADAKTATRIGFDKAFSSILDGNVTNLIVCVVLAYTGTAEIRGFAITMGIGVVSTLFAALIFSRLLFGVALNTFGWKNINMLPLAVPAIQRTLTPNVDWLRLRPAFFTFSISYVLLGLGFVVFQGREMLDNEFRGGTAVTLEFKQKSPGSTEHVTLTRAEVKARVEAIGAAAAQDNPLRELVNAEVLPIDPEADGVTSDKFTVKTILTDGATVQESLVGKFSDVMELSPALKFKGAEADSLRDAPVYRLVSPDLGTNLGRTLSSPKNVGDMVGGVAIVIDKLEPAVPLSTLTSRLDAVRARPQFADTLARKHAVIVLEGTDQAVQSAAFVVFDETARVFDNEARWTESLATREWKLVTESLTQAQVPASVVLFSAAIADTFRAQAIVATVVSFLLISIYIWFRFKSLRYSLAALIALVHDVVVVIACVALCEVLYKFPATEKIALALGLLPFRIDLNMIAALLTIAGYSLNDTIVIMDRIRETKGKSQEADYEMINDAVNGTLSRTVITGGSTLFSCLTLYILGGEGMRPFAFALTIGLIVGTYSSVGVAAPLVWSGKHKKADEPVPGDGAVAVTGR
ncbi:MAG: protein translocase subunit SecD [Phycisphaerales bacterium]|nr:protein translocase subunit SecD [Phycisphaerales bacterium]